VLRGHPVEAEGADGVAGAIAPDGRLVLPYESGIDTYGDTHGRFGLSFYIYALLFVAFDIEVVFIYLWALVFRDPSVDMGSLFISMLVFVAILLFGLAYAWRKGVLSWRLPGEAVGDRPIPSGDQAPE
jgi:NADH-quinone oxidoreductase subunit A